MSSTYTSLNDGQVLLLSSRTHSPSDRGCKADLY
jgi:hypothetical protein